MKIYLLIMLIGIILTAVHFTAAPEQQSRNAPAIALAALKLSSHQPLYNGPASGKLPFPAKISCTSLLGRLTHR